MSVSTEKVKTAENMEEMVLVTADWNQYFRGGADDMLHDLQTNHMDRTAVTQNETTALMRKQKQGRQKGKGQKLSQHRRLVSTVGRMNETLHIMNKQHNKNSLKTCRTDECCEQGHSKTARERLTVTW